MRRSRSRGLETFDWARGVEHRPASQESISSLHVRKICGCRCLCAFYLLKIDAQKDRHRIECSNAKSFAACRNSRSSHALRTKIPSRPSDASPDQVSIPSFGDEAKPVSNNQRYHTT